MTEQQYPGWYKAFQEQHPTYNGQVYPTYPNAVMGQTPPAGQQPTGTLTPEEYYGQTDETLGSALDDYKWSQEFLQNTGKAPTDYDWNLHWYVKHRYGSGPMEQGYQGQPRVGGSSWTPPWVYWR